ncbi:MAG: nuclear transport factor 2 family protein [Actinomycetia bacterium]|nr:nuclear transport factor 2 family protein [Actinomycetes bacterium]
MKIVDSAYEALDSKDGSGFADCLAEDVRIQLINDPAIHGRENAREFFTARLAMVDEPEHTTINLWELDDTVICEDASHTKRLNGERVSVKGLAFWRVKDEEIFDLRVYEDLSPFADDFAAHQVEGDAPAEHWSLGFFRALDARDVDAATALLSDDATYQLGSTEEVASKPAVRAKLEEFLGEYPAIRHDLLGTRDVDDSLALLQFTTSYATGNGRIVTIPEAAIVRRSGGRVTAVRSFMDLTTAGNG